jgi:hypothetical protein
METQLAERVAINAWRLRRAYRVESGLFERMRTAWARVGRNIPPKLISCSCVFAPARAMSFEALAL